MKPRCSILFVIIFSVSLFSQKASHPGAISPEVMETIRTQYDKNPAPDAVINAVTNQGNVSDLTLNRSHLPTIDHHFGVKVETKGITNQKSSGRCWLFTGLNVLRPKVMEKFNLKSFEFSENYSFFFDQLEKSNLFLEGIIDTRDMKMDHRRVEWLFKHPIGDGGVWNNLISLVEKYGLVPQSAMPETEHSSGTRTMSRMIRRKLREDGLVLRRMHQDGKKEKALRQAKVTMLADIYRMLVIHLGEPPETFTWRYEDQEGAVSQPQTFTPQDFYQHVLGDDLNEYVMLMNVPTRDYYKFYEIDYDRNAVEYPNWTFVNLPNEVLKSFAKKSLLAGEAMYFSCDVGKQLNRDLGVLSVENYDYESLYGITFGMDKKDRVMTFESGSSHAMNLVGMDTLSTGDVDRWLLENSWGADSGHNGFLTMTDDWFDQYMFRLVVKKEFITPDVLKITRDTPEKLKPWDPMYLPLEDL